MKLSKRARWGIRIGLVFGIVFAVLSSTAILFPREALTEDSGEVKGDVIVVLGGGSLERVKRASELFKTEAALKIICTGVGDCDSNKRELVKADVPETAIETECEARNTSENARFTIPRLRTMHAKRVILVTTWYHSRRALHCFQHYAPDIEFFSRPSYLGYDSKDRQAVRRYLWLEYPKLLGYWVRYGVCPF